ncbi:MAG: hypothetical protein OXG81_13380 [Acidobacteria bacterium]|nr:hypothetical protein [Acidobacteriota bacterium]
MGCARSGAVSSACREASHTGAALWVRGPSGPLPPEAARNTPPRSGDRNRHRRLPYHPGPWPNMLAPLPSFADCWSPAAAT